MSRRPIYALLFIFILLLQACGPREVTTATEPNFEPISTESVQQEDIDLYQSLESVEVEPANLIDLGVSILGVDPAKLPEVPSQPVAAYKVGDTRKFWTHDDGASKHTNITAELMYISKHAYFWQDVDAEALNAQNEPATKADWEAAGESFDTSYERVRTVFGGEESPGLDGDPRLFVINSDTVGVVGGYFGPADQLPAAVEPKSNVGQYFYVSNQYSSGIASDYYKEVLAHEFQHMIRKNVDPNEEGWMNEGLSMLAQQVAGMHGDNFVADYLIKPDQSLWYWSGEAQDYGQSYLYLDYLHEQMGEEFTKALGNSQADGLASIDQILTEMNSPRNADDMYADAITAVFLNNLELADGQYGYSIATVIPMTPRYEFKSTPSVYQGGVQQYGGVDLVTFEGKGSATLTFTGDQRIKLIPTDAHSGEHFWWSNRYDASFSTLTREVDLTSVSEATLNFWAWYDAEENFDFGYVLASKDGGKHWETIRGTTSREDDPNNLSLGSSFTGKSGDGVKDAVWVEQTANLNRFTGNKILLRFAMMNDLVVNEFGFAVDDVSIPEIGWSDDFESGAGDWISGGFVLSTNYVPQVWRVRAVEEKSDGSVVVHDIDLLNGVGTLDINFKGLDRLVVFVIGQTRYTTTPAYYQVEMK